MATKGDALEQAREMSAADELRAAARLIDRALLKLDSTSAPCANCRRVHFRHRGHGGILEAMGGWPQRLRRAANDLEAMPETDPAPGFGKSLEQFRRAGS